jgi:lambda repressor-like predicted transcriptional regulator
MCLEHDWHDCHRAIVTKRLEKKGFTATHLAPEPRG